MDAPDLVNNNPVVCATYLNRLFDAIMNIMKGKPDSAFRSYFLVGFFKKVEFQLIGSSLVYSHLYLNNMPNEQLTMDMPQTTSMSDILMSLDKSLTMREI